MRDLMNNIHTVRAISPVSVSDNTAQESEIIDTQGYDSLTFVIATGSLADSDVTFAVLVEDGDNSGLSDNDDVSDDYLVGTESDAGFQFDDDDETRKIGYVGTKRYVRLTITPSGNTSAALLSAVAVLGHPSRVPTDNPPE